MNNTTHGRSHSHDDHDHNEDLDHNDDHYQTPTEPNLPTIQSLDNQQQIQRLDVSNVLGSLQALAHQAEDAWDQTQQLDLKLDASLVQNIVVAGMGGSALGPHIAKTLFSQQFKLPLEIVNDYHLPGYVNRNTLVIVSSYSGTTEETVAAMHQAHDLGAQMLFITTGGQLAEFASQHNYDCYLINPQHNPSGQPRMALGYAVYGLLGLLSRAGFIELSDSVVNESIGAIRQAIAKYDVGVSQEKNQAKQLAFQILGRIPIFVGAEHLAGALHAAQNQFNENGKTYADYRLIPELNHHLMEGLRFPQTNDANLFFVVFQSSLYHERNQKRIEITSQVIEAANIEFISYTLAEPQSLSQVAEVLCFAAYSNFYLAMLEEIDPAVIETVDFFKKQLS